MSELASGITVYEASWLPCWQFSVTTPNGMTFGTAPTEAEAWEKARTLLAAFEERDPRA